MTQKILKERGKRVQVKKKFINMKYRIQSQMNEEKKKRFFVVEFKKNGVNVSRRP